MAKVKIKVYKWAGKFGPFKIESTCGECRYAMRVINDVCDEFGDAVSIKEAEWLSNWYKPILKGGWHAPIVMVNGKVLSQGVVVDRDILRGTLIKEIFKDYKAPKDKNIIFTLPKCRYCKEAKKILKDAGIKFEARDVLHNNINMQKMLSLILGKIHPISMPQIFIKGKWIKGTDELKKYSRKELKKLDKS